MHQIEIDFESGLTKQHELLMDVCRAAAYGCGRPLKSIAAHMDLSQSDLSRKLAENPDDGRRLNVRELPLLIEATGEKGKDVIYWLIERFLEDDGTRRDRALDLLRQMAPQFMALMAEAVPADSNAVSKLHQVTK